MEQKLDSDVTDAIEDAEAQLPTESAILSDPNQDPRFIIQRKRLYTIVLSLCLCLFLSTLESTVIGTALVAITNDLQGFNISSWIVTSYLLTYTGFLTALAKLSDTFGRRNVMCLCIIIFIIFSIACGVAETMLQLIVFRAFQGIGGGGMYTMAFVIIPELVPPSKYAAYSGLIAGVAALSSLLGPIFGGIISNRGNWEWIFLFNAPNGTVTLILFYFALPPAFPYNMEDANAPVNLHLAQKVRRIDYVGLLLILASSFLLVTAIQEGGIAYPWDSGVILSLLILSISCTAGLVCWGWSFTRRSTTAQEPVLPWTIVSDRYALGLLLVCFFTGLGFITCVIILPQHFQIVFQDSPARAGFRLLAMTLVVPLGSGAAGLALQNLHTPALYVFLTGFAFIILGTGLSTVVKNVADGFPTHEYGFQVTMGFGFGINLAAAVMAAPLAFRPQHLAVGMGTSNQFRVLGGSIGVAICANILNDHLANRLRGLLSPDQIRALLASAQTLAFISPDLRQAVRDTFAESFVMQMQVILGLSCAGLLATLLMIERQPRYQHYVFNRQNRGIGRYGMLLDR
ncbi:major facilitator superfamily transporter [Karstenula rhodostoma CBS 690.94]|uniref:Major facilitator superfamily transporter n=1 Tax=Karstenula rhodostoma CBS 690.94 TaxID=1392251 RepID=A0A9P4UD75_9PLEO|nr:major facilitator superfamily transporter [Karstenula rhodostoma CBS 690.94]